MWFKIDSENGVVGEYKILIKIESNVTSKEISLNLTIAPVKFPDVPDYNLAMWDGAVDVQRAITSANIEKAFEEGITVQMAHKSYVEKCRVEWLLSKGEL